MALQQELRLIIGRLEDFSLRVKQGLDQVDWQTRRELIRTLVKQVEIDHNQVNIVFRVEPSLPTSEPSKDFLQLCTRRNGSTAAQRLFGHDFPDLFDWVLEHVGDLPMPRRSSKAQQPKFLYADGFSD